MVGRVPILVGVADFDLVIFDCDGVLVDSERLAIRTEADILASLGWPLTQAEIVARFVGRSAAHMQREIERQLGRRIDWEAEFEPRYREVFERELVAVGVDEEAEEEKNRKLNVQLLFCFSAECAARRHPSAFIEVYEKCQFGFFNIAKRR